MLEWKWRNSVLEYSLRDQARLVVRAWERVRGDGGGFPDPTGAKGGALPHPTRSLWLLLSAFALLLYGYWRLRRLLSRGRGLHPATRLRDDAEALLARAGLPPQAGEGFEERARRLDAEGHPAAEALAEVVQRWAASRFGGGALPPAERKVLLGTLRRALSRR